VQQLPLFVVSKQTDEKSISEIFNLIFDLSDLAAPCRPCCFCCKHHGGGRELYCGKKSKWQAQSCLPNTLIAVVAAFDIQYIKGCGDGCSDGDVAKATYPN
jgi:hypothetical protein